MYSINHLIVILYSTTGCNIEISGCVTVLLMDGNANNLRMVVGIGLFYALLFVLTRNYARVDEFSYDEII